METFSTVVIGAGHSGLAMSEQLSGRGVDHVVLERGAIANSWRTKRWDSLKLLTPNWMNNLPGHAYDGGDPDGYMNMAELVARFDASAEWVAAPVRAGVTVGSVSRNEDGFQVVTDHGTLQAKAVVMANGGCAIPRVPEAADALPGRIAQVTPNTYKRPAALPAGRVLVVGASASGVQLAREIHQSGRPVTIAVGGHTRLPRQYRGRDILLSMKQAGILDSSQPGPDDIERLRRAPSLQLTAGETLDLNTLQADGVEITGRLATIRDGTAHLSGSLANLCASADLKLNRVLAAIDEWAATADPEPFLEPPERFASTNVPDAPRLTIDLNGEGFGAVLWATGFRPDYSWLDLPVFDRKGRLIHDGGHVAPGLYVMGLPFMRAATSTYIDGGANDAAALAAHLHTGLAARNAA
ncbi:MAG: NAD(P)-binding domain-containing protein [Hyphomicrobiales bacterium]|nr:NAD(P)-binding domain-containing protein [Hyphomicrobiales bacterium]